MTAYWTLSQTRQDSFTVVSWEIQIEKDDVGTGYGSRVDLIDITKHRLPVPVACKSCVDVMVFERLVNEKDVRGVVLNQDDVQLAARCPGT
jgi:hypothetical protein